MKISKELLSAVIGKDIAYVELVGNYIVYKISVYDREEEINIYEFIHKVCKEWAYRKGYFLNYITRTNPRSYTHIMNIDSMDGKKCTEYIRAFDNEDNKYKEDMEKIYIVKACEWIVNKIQ